MTLYLVPKLHKRRTHNDVKDKREHMRMTIAFLQLLPTRSLQRNMEKGVKATRIFDGYSHWIP